MTFKDLLVALHSVKVEAKKQGLSEKDIQNLELIDVGLMNSINKINFDITLGKHKISHYLLMKKK